MKNYGELERVLSASAYGLDRYTHLDLHYSS